MRQVLQSRQISTRAYFTKYQISGWLGCGQKMLGVSVSRETLTPNAGYVVGILLRPVREALRPGKLTRLPLGKCAGAGQGR